MPRASTSTNDKKGKKNSNKSATGGGGGLWTVKPEPRDDDEYLDIGLDGDKGFNDDDEYEYRFDGDNGDEDEDEDELMDDAPTATQRLNAFGLDELPESVIRKVKIGELYDALNNDEIILDPPYQRDVVWNLSKRIGLIDSIFRNFYIPPVVFAIHPAPNDTEGDVDDHSQGRREIRVCVDGKQRLTSIRNFIDGKIPFKHTTLRKSYWYTDAPEDDQEPGPSSRTGNKSKKIILPPNFKEVFNAKEITVVEYRHLTDPLERDLFRRVQLGMSLNSAEKLQAISSPWADWISSLDLKYLAPSRSTTTMYKLMTMDTSRGRGFLNLTQMIWACEVYKTRGGMSVGAGAGAGDGTMGTAQPQPTFTAGPPTYTALFSFLSRDSEPSEEFKREIERVLSAMSEIVRDGEGRGWARVFGKGEGVGNGNGNGANGVNANVVNANASGVAGNGVNGVVGTETEIDVKPNVKTKTKTKTKPKTNKTTPSRLSLASRVAPVEFLFMGVVLFVFSEDVLGRYLKAKEAGGTSNSRLNVIASTSGSTSASAIAFSGFNPSTTLHTTTSTASLETISANPHIHNPLHPSPYPLSSHYRSPYTSSHYPSSHYPYSYPSSHYPSSYPLSSPRDIQSHLLYTLRTKARNKFIDLRTNGVVCRELWGYVSEFWGEYGRVGVESVGVESVGGALGASGVVVNGGGGGENGLNRLPTDKDSTARPSTQNIPSTQFPSSTQDSSLTQPSSAQPSAQPSLPQPSLTQLSSSAPQPSRLTPRTQGRKPIPLPVPTPRIQPLAVAHKIKAESPVRTLGSLVRGQSQSSSARAQGQQSQVQAQVQGKSQSQVQVQAQGSTVQAQGSNIQSQFQSWYRPLVTSKSQAQAQPQIQPYGSQHHIEAPTRLNYVPFQFSRVQSQPNDSTVTEFSSGVHTRLQTNTAESHSSRLLLSGDVTGDVSAIDDVVVDSAVGADEVPPANSGIGSTTDIMPLANSAVDCAIAGVDSGVDGVDDIDAGADADADVSVPGPGPVRVVDSATGGVSDDDDLEYVEELVYPEEESFEDAVMRYESMDEEVAVGEEVMLDVDEALRMDEVVEKDEVVIEQLESYDEEDFEAAVMRYESMDEEVGENDEVVKRSEKPSEGVNESDDAGKRKPDDWRARREVEERLRKELNLERVQRVKEDEERAKVEEEREREKLEREEKERLEREAKERERKARKERKRAEGKASQYAATDIAAPQNIAVSNVADPVTLNGAENNVMDDETARTQAIFEKKLAKRERKKQLIEENRRVEKINEMKMAELHLQTEADKARLAERVQEPVRDRDQEQQQQQQRDDDAAFALSVEPEELQRRAQSRAQEEEEEEEEEMWAKFGHRHRLHLKRSPVKRRDGEMGGVNGSEQEESEDARAEGEIKSESESGSGKGMVLYEGEEEKGPRTDGEDEEDGRKTLKVVDDEEEERGMVDTDSVVQSEDGRKMLKDNDQGERMRQFMGSSNDEQSESESGVGLTRTRRGDFRARRSNALPSSRLAHVDEPVFRIFRSRRLQAANMDENDEELSPALSIGGRPLAADAKGKQRQQEEIDNEDISPTMSTTERLERDDTPIATPPVKITYGRQSLVSSSSTAAPAASSNTALASVSASRQPIADSNTIPTLDPSFKVLPGMKFGKPKKGMKRKREVTDIDDTPGPPAHSAPSASTPSKDPKPKSKSTSSRLYEPSTPDSSSNSASHPATDSIFTTDSLFSPTPSEHDDSLSYSQSRRNSSESVQPQMQSQNLPIVISSTSHGLKRRRTEGQTPEASVSSHNATATDAAKSSSRRNALKPTSSTPRNATSSRHAASSRKAMSSRNATSSRSTRVRRRDDDDLAKMDEDGYDIEDYIAQMKGDVVELEFPVLRKTVGR